MSGALGHPAGPVVRRLRAVANLRPDPVAVKVPLVEFEQVVTLAEERLQQLERPKAETNGGVFLTILDGQVVAAHDRGLINENALSATLQELLEGKALTVDSLAAIFGVDVILTLVATLPPVRPETVELLATAVAHKLREDGIHG